MPAWASTVSDYDVLVSRDPPDSRNRGDHVASSVDTVASCQRSDNASSFCNTFCAGASTTVSVHPVFRVSASSEITILNDCGDAWDERDVRICDTIRYRALLFYFRALHSCRTVDLQCDCCKKNKPACSSLMLIDLKIYERRKQTLWIHLTSKKNCVLQ